MGWPDPCKDLVQDPVNFLIIDPINSILTGLCNIMNVIIGLINLLTAPMAIGINLFLTLINDFLTGFFKSFNTVMNDFRTMIDLITSISTGHIIGWISLIISPLILGILSLVGIHLKLSTIMLIIKIYVYAVIFGNFYNFLDFISSDYTPQKPQFPISNCNNF